MRKTAVPSSVLITVFFPTHEEADAFYAALDAARVPFERTSLLAHGLGADRDLFADPERNVNLSSSEAARPASASVLGRRTSCGKKFLIDGCWAMGPLFELHVCECDPLAMADLTTVLVAAGFPFAEAVELEKELKSRGGVWVAVEVDPEQAEEVKALAARSARSAEVRVGALRAALPLP